jgi:hypothetical protein
MSIKNLPMVGGGGGGRAVGMRVMLTAPTPSVSRRLQSVGASMSQSPVDLHGLIQGELYLFFIFLTLFCSSTCHVSFIVCAGLCEVFCLRTVCCVLYLIVVLLLRVKPIYSSIKVISVKGRGGL